MYLCMQATHVSFWWTSINILGVFAAPSLWNHLPHLAHSLTHSCLVAIYPFLSFLSSLWYCCIIVFYSHDSTPVSSQPWNYSIPIIHLVDNWSFVQFRWKMKRMNSKNREMCARTTYGVGKLIYENVWPSWSRWYTGQNKNGLCRRKIYHHQHRSASSGNGNSIININTTMYYKMPATSLLSNLILRVRVCWLISITWRLLEETGREWKKQQQLLCTT